jgi:hypothetical protein
MAAVAGNDSGAAVRDAAQTTSTGSVRRDVDSEAAPLRGVGRRKIGLH